MGLKHQATRVRVEDNQDRAWSIIGRPLADGVLVTFEDQTEYERQRRERERVDRLAEIGQMTAAIAHEIRNPLTGIRSAAQVVRSAPESCRELGAMIEEEATKLNDLCDSFLDFARPLSLVTRELRWSDIVAPVLEQHRAEIEAAGIQVRLKSEPDEPIITGDRVRLEQVFRNLLLNAVQATRPGGLVEVRCEGGKLIVQDNGVGMTEEDRQKLFTPFFTTKPSGTGLGLCNARKVVDAHGGSLSVTSSPDMGSCFVVDLSPRKCA
jgi:two-component system sensor histidine kinase PilS (NtrC family)